VVHGVFFVGSFFFSSFFFPVLFMRACVRPVREKTAWFFASKKKDAAGVGNSGSALAPKLGAWQRHQPHRK
jgi:hypothetical protein